MKRKIHHSLQGVSNRRALSTRITRGMPAKMLNPSQFQTFGPGRLSDPEITYTQRQTYGAAAKPPPLLKRQTTGLPRPDCPIEAETSPRQIVSIIGAPMVFGQKLVGTELAPDALRQNGLQDRIRSIDGGSFLVEDLGNLDLPQRSRLGPRGQFADVIGRGNEIICQKCCEYMSDNSKFVLTLGGDHSIALGSMTAAITARPDTVVVWVDAHADLNTPESSISGSYHGMPVGIAMRLPGWPEDLNEFGWLNGYGQLDPKNIVYIGLRDLDHFEKKTIKKLGIKAYTMHHIDRLGIGNVMQEVMEYVGGRPMHLSFDIDACDPFFAGSTGTHVRGGLTFRETQYICEVLADSNELGSMDLVEVNPNLSAHSSTDTCEAAITIIESCLGKSLL